MATATAFNATHGEAKCGFCSQLILNTDSLNVHHIQPRSEGGSDHESNLTPTHAECHRQWHQTPKADGFSDFQRWGKLSSLTCAWAFNLKGVKDNPVYDMARAFYRLFYSNPESRKGLQ